MTVEDKHLHFGAGGDKRVGTLKRILQRDMMPLHEAMVDLGRIASPKSKYGKVCDLASWICLEVAVLSGRQAELSQNDDMWGQCDGLELQPLRRMGSRKCRRISLAYKVALGSAVRGSKELHTPGQLLA